MRPNIGFYQSDKFGFFSLIRQNTSIQSVGSNEMAYGCLRATCFIYAYIQSASSISVSYLVSYENGTNLSSVICDRRPNYMLYAKEE